MSYYGYPGYARAYHGGMNNAEQLTAEFLVPGQRRMEANRAWMTGGAGRPFNMPPIGHRALRRDVFTESQIDRLYRRHNMARGPVSFQYGFYRIK